MQIEKLNCYSFLVSVFLMLAKIFVLVDWYVQHKYAKFDIYPLKNESSRIELFKKNIPQDEQRRMKVWSCGPAMIA